MLHFVHYAHYDWFLIYINNVLTNEILQMHIIDNWENMKHGVRNISVGDSEVI